MYKIQEDPKISKELTLARGTDAGLLSCLEETANGPAVCKSCRELQGCSFHALSPALG